MTRRLPPRAILFDLGDTLCTYSIPPKSRQRLLTREVEKILRTSGAEISVHAYRVVRSRLWNEWKNAFGRRGKEFKLDQFLFHLLKTLHLKEPLISTLAWRLEDAIYRCDLSALVSVPQAQETVRFLRKRGYLLGVVSNSAYSYPHIVRILKKIGVYHWLDSVVVSSTEGVAKPNPIIFRRAARRLCVPPSKIVFVGDRLDVDMLGAKKVGMKTIWKVESDGRTPARIVDVRISRLSQIPSVMETWGPIRAE